MRIGTVYFDLGMVLASPGRVFRQLAARFEVSEAELMDAYWHRREDYDRGLPPVDYWASVAAKLNRVRTQAELIEYAYLDQEIWADIRPAAELLLAKTAASDVSVGLLSNAPTPLIDIVPTKSWARYLDHTVISAAVGYAKPDPEIYALAESLCGANRSAIAFIDDRPENVVAATAQGWQAHLWVSDEDSKTWLNEIGVL